MQIVRQFQDILLVKISEGFHLVRYNPETNTIKAVHSADRMNNELKNQVGFSADRIFAITKPRKKATALAYWQELVRYEKRKTNG